MIEPAIEKVIWFYGIYQPLYDEIPDVTFVEGFPCDYKSYIGGRTLFVIDDLIAECDNSKELVKLSIRLHLNLVCDVCKKTFSNKSNLKSHMKKHGDHVNHACSQCRMKFYRVDKLQEHMRTHTREKKTHPCEQCDQVFPRMSDLLRHKRTDHSAPPAPRIAAAPRVRNCGRNVLGVYSSHFMTPTPTGQWDLLLFFEEVRPQIHDMIVDELQQKRAIKW
ncbi:hypothetical protein AVEN_104502-1 [Araneus ventricosus]|uniref:C2H2-type domain-containing protein n=1 Tax=Araneus ventricosus TaxID=182803 RepID=A0A4Y2M7X8_ARAVE|nr:hypothetical protein AVEN_104502-1 [Araneus ventricosus]